MKPGIDARLPVRAVPDGPATRLVADGKNPGLFARLAWRDADLLMVMPDREVATLLKLPARPGSTWAAGPGRKARVLPDAEISVPAGRFRCIVVRLEGATGERETYWLAPDVGFVRVLRESGGRRDEAVLLESGGPEVRTPPATRTSPGSPPAAR